MAFQSSHGVHKAFRDERNACNSVGPHASLRVVSQSRGSESEVVNCGCRVEDSLCLSGQRRVVSSNTEAIVALIILTFCEVPPWCHQRSPTQARSAEAEYRQLTAPEMAGHMELGSSW